MDNSVKFDEFLEQHMKDPEFRKEYAALEEEYASEAARIRQRLQMSEPRESRSNGEPGEFQ